MISACFITVLCIKMESENSGIKSEGRDESIPENTEYSHGGEYQTAASAAR